MAPDGDRSSGKQSNRALADRFLVDYEITNAGRSVEMTREQLQALLKANGGGRLRKDQDEFEDDYATDQVDFVHNAVISWEPLEKET